jgi:hypothetical protein
MEALVRVCLQQSSQLALFAWRAVLQPPIGPQLLEQKVVQFGGVGAVWAMYFGPLYLQKVRCDLPADTLVTTSIPDKAQIFASEHGV